MDTRSSPPDLEAIVDYFSRVLAAVDFSKPARSAFEHALALSQQHGAELIAVQAIPRDEASSWRAEDRLALAEELRRRAEQAHVTFSHRVQQGDPAEVVVLQARSAGADIIVVGTHQRKGLVRFREGSVAERVAVNADAPVLVIPAERTVGAARPFSHVAVGVDFSAASDRAIEQALDLAESATADRITLLHVVPGFSSGVPAHLYRYGAAEYQDELIRAARSRLQRAVPVNRHTPAAIHTRVVVGNTTAEIGRIVDAIGADLLVVGVPKRGVIARSLFGTTAARLLKVTRVPVLAVPGVRAPDVDEARTSRQLAA